VAWDHLFNHWVYFGTGRLYVNDDLDNIEQQTLYGIMDISDRDPAEALPVVKTDLLNVSNAKVYTDGAVTGVTDAPEFDDLEVLIDGGANSAGDTFTGLNGWYKNLIYDGVNPSERILNQQALLGQVLFASAYTPGADVCGALGSSNLYGVYYRTGTAVAESSILGTDASDTHGVSGLLSMDKLDLGSGLGSSPSLHTGEGSGVDDDHSTDITVITQTGVAAIERGEAKALVKVRSGEISWREIQNAVSELP
jgi:type IV pilus assembly protein PilY1